MAAIDLIAVPYDSGRRDYRMGAGPAAFIDGGLPASLARMGHHVRVTWIETSATDPLASAVELAAGVSTAVQQARQADRLPIVLSGNCISTVGVVAGLSADVAVVWLDAHGDLNTPTTSPSGFLDGMAAATLLGWCHQAEFAAVPGNRPLPVSRLLVIGCRALDPPEARAMTAAGIAQVDPEAAGNETELGRQLDRVLGTAPEVHLHIDLDVLDPDEWGPANSYAAPGGLTQQQTIRVVQMVVARRPIASLTLSSYDPAVDAQGLIRTAALPFMLQVLPQRMA